MAFLEGNYQPRENDERLALLGVCPFQDRLVATVGLYAAVFAADPTRVRHLVDYLCGGTQIAKRAKPMTLP